MSWIVLDASVALSWCFSDEQNPASPGVLDRLKDGDQALGPAFWCSQALNSLWVGERKGRISARQTRAFRNDLSALGPTLDDASWSQNRQKSAHKEVSGADFGVLRSVELP